MARRVPAVSAILAVLAGCFVAGAGAAPGPWLFVTEPYPPYTYADKGQAAGPLVDVVQAACAQLKRVCRIEVLPWRRALAMGERGEADGIFSFVDAPERRALFHVSTPLVDGRYVLFARAGEAFAYRDPGSLAGRTVGVYGPSGASLALDELARAARFETVLEADNLTVIRKLQAGRYGEHGLALMNENVALALLRADSGPGLQMAGVAKSFRYSVGLSRQRVSEAEFRAFDAALVGLCRSGRTAELVKPYALPASACKTTP